jgi:hypothetical protein
VWPRDVQIRQQPLAAGADAAVVAPVVPAVRAVDELVVAWRPLRGLRPVRVVPLPPFLVVRLLRAVRAARVPEVLSLPHRVVQAVDALEAHPVVVRAADAVGGAVPHRFPRAASATGPAMRHTRRPSSS